MRPASSPARPEAARPSLRRARSLRRLPGGEAVARALPQRGHAELAGRREGDGESWRGRARSGRAELATPEKRTRRSGPSSAGRCDYFFGFREERREPLEVVGCVNPIDASGARARAVTPERRHATDDVRVTDEVLVRPSLRSTSLQCLRCSSAEERSRRRTGSASDTKPSESVTPRSSRRLRSGKLFCSP